MTGITFLLVCILFYIVLKDRKKEKDNKANERYKYNPQTKSFDEVGFDNAAPAEESAKYDIRGAYYAKDLLTKNERRAYSKLKVLTDPRNLVICPKVRLADLVHPHHNKPNYYSYFGRIQSKHVDFVICNQRMDVIGIIELDDNSHNRPDRQERDQLVDDILTSVGYKIVHTREITPDILDNFL